MKSRLGERKAITLSSSTNDAVWRPPGPIVITDVSLFATGFSATAGTDGAWAAVSIDSPYSTLVDTGNELLIAIINFQSGGVLVHYSNGIQLKTWKIVRPGNAIYLHNDAWASGGIISSAMLTYEMLRAS